MRTCFSFSTTALLMLASATFAAEPYKAATGPSVVTSVESDWKDAARDVTVPVKLYFPKEIAAAKEALPLIVFSHGLGGSREGYAFWAEHWASWGYIVVLPTHVGSDTSLITGGETGRGAGIRGLLAGRGGTTGPAASGVMGDLRSAASPENAVRRCKDVSFVIDQMEKANGGTLEDKNFAPLKGKIDLKHIGMSGHSFGAQTTLSIAGEQFGRRSMSDPRVTAAIAMSPQPAMLGDQKTAFGAIKIPVFHITGTNDASPAGLSDVKPADRRVPFDNSTFSDTYLAIFKGSTHMTFAPGRTGEAVGERLRQVRGGGAVTAGSTDEQAIHTFVKESTTAFWDAYLKSDDRAKKWLQTDFSPLMGTAGTFETKRH